MRVLANGMLSASLLAVLQLGLLPIAYADSYELGLKMYEQGDYAVAIRYLREAATANNGNPNARYYLADSYLKLDRLTEAQAEYQQILALAPDSQAARLSRMALSNLRAYLDNTRNDRWRQAGGSGRGNVPDQYLGPPPSGEDYLDDVTSSGRIVRWALSKMPLKVYVEQSPQGIRNFQPAFISQVNRAMDVWCNALNHQLSYALVNSPEQADIQVVWTNTIDTKGHDSDGGTAYTAGLTLPHIRDEQLQSMEVKIATFDISGNPQNSDVIYAVAIHELGHSLGLLGHSSDPADIMFARNQHVITPSQRDMNTIRRLYMATADINNLPASARHIDPKRQDELANKMDETITKLESQAKQSGMALSWLNLGIGYFQKGKQLAQKENNRPATPEEDPKTWYTKALDAINQALRLEPNDPRAYHKRSLVYQELNDYPDALNDIQKAVSLDRREPEYYMLQAWYLAKLGQLAQARSSLDTYLLYKPGEANSTDVQQIKALLSKEASKG